MLLVHTPARSCAPIKALPQANWTGRALSSRHQSLICRSLATASARPNRYDAVVIGAGPGGLTSASHLLDQGLEKICLIDDAFTAGRINERYREVPSNTKTMMFQKWSTGTKTFETILNAAPRPNAYEKLLEFDQNAGCSLGSAIDVALLLSDGLRKDPRVHSITSRVNTLNKLDDGRWTMPDFDLVTDRVVLAVGSHPKKYDLADHYPEIKPLDLDVCLKPSQLQSSVPAGSKVAVIGASHSAILALKNLYELGNVEVINFHRSPLLYAIYKEGWILYDNTGLKGIAADWAREVLAAPTLPKNLRRVNLKSEANKDRSEKQIYDEELQGVTHLVSAIGYARNPIPKITVSGSTIEPAFDDETGRFFDAHGSKEYLRGLFGTGIAYPNRVVDRMGNQESAVGWFKFHNFMKRVAPEWTSHP